MKTVCFFLSIVFTPTVFAEADLSIFGKADAFASAMVSDGSQNLKNYELAWQQKCGAIRTLQPTCFLTEKDVDSAGSADRIVLFRGEVDRFAKPLSSGFFRQFSAKNQFCEKGCSKRELAEKLRQTSSGLSHALWPDKLYYRASTDSWVTRSGKKETPALSPAVELASAHLHGNRFFFEDTRESFDPFVSFSANPSVASSFASGRVVFVISVPAKEIVELQEGLCDQWIDQPNLYYQLQKCGTYSDPKGEVEISAVFFGVTEHLRAILTFDDAWYVKPPK